MITKEKLPPPVAEDGFLTHAAEKLVEYALMEFARNPSDMPLEARFQDLLQKPWLKGVLNAHGNSKIKAASALGINRLTLRRRCRRYGVGK